MKKQEERKSRLNRIPPEPERRKDWVDALPPYGVIPDDPLDLTRREGMMVLHRDEARELVREYKKQVLDLKKIIMDQKAELNCLYLQMERVEHSMLMLRGPSGDRGYLDGLLPFVARQAKPPIM